MTNPNPHKYGAIQVFVDPRNYLSFRLERDQQHTLRFPSKYEYKVYCGIRSYLDRTNKQYSGTRFNLELQYQIILIPRSGLTSQLTHVVDFVIRDNQSSSNPILYVEAKGQFLKEYSNKMKVLQAVKPNVYSRYLVISDNEPPKGYQAYYCQIKKLEAALYALGIK